MIITKAARIATISLLALTMFISSCNNDDDGLSVQDQFKFENEKIDSYIADNGIFAETDLNTALRYRVLNQGTGIQPWVADSITVSYTVQLLDTEEILETITNEKIAYEKLILGIRIGLHFVQEGGAIQFFVPSPYAYGSTGRGNVIPANATLIYSLELHEVHAQQLRADIEAIDTYLADNNMGAIKHPSGLRYEIIEPGAGEHPYLFSVVVVDYEGRLFPSGSLFDARDNVGLLLGEVISGWQIGIPQIKEGGRVLLYIPSSLGFGEPGSPPDIPANSNLFFDVTLKDIQ